MTPPPSPAARNRPRRIAIALSKGGVGKTTTAVNLAHGLALEGARVLLVDTDTQGQCAPALGVNPSHGLMSVIAMAKSPSNGESADIAITAVRDNLSFIAGGDDLAGGDFGSGDAIARALRPLEDRFDYVVIDCAPGWDELSVSVLLYAGEVLSPVSLDLLTLHGLAAFQQRIEKIRQHNPSLSLAHILPTFQDGRVRKSAEILSALRGSYSPSLLCDPIRYSAKLSEAPGYGQTIFEYAPTSPAAIDYRYLTNRILK